MATIKSVKADLTEHLSKIDKEKLSICDLKVYADIVRVVDDMEKQDNWKTFMNGFSALSAAPAYRPAEVKEE